MITPANPPALENKPILADLDGDSDRCPDVIATDGGAHSLQHWPAQMASGQCALRRGLDAAVDLLRCPRRAGRSGTRRSGPCSSASTKARVSRRRVDARRSAAGRRSTRRPARSRWSTTGDIDGDGRPDLVCRRCRVARRRRAVPHERRYASYRAVPRIDARRRSRRSRSATSTATLTRTSRTPSASARTNA